MNSRSQEYHEVGLKFTKINNQNQQVISPLPLHVVFTCRSKMPRAMLGTPSLTVVHASIPERSTSSLPMLCTELLQMSQSPLQLSRPVAKSSAVTSQLQCCETEIAMPLLMVASMAADLSASYCKKNCNEYFLLKTYRHLSTKTVLLNKRTAFLMEKELFYCPIFSYFNSMWTLHAMPCIYRE